MYRLSEVPQPAQIWLSNNLGITPNQDLLALEDWESFAARSAQRLLNYGELERLSKS